MLWWKKKSGSYDEKLVVMCPPVLVCGALWPPPSRPDRIEFQPPSKLPTLRDRFGVGARVRTVWAGAGGIGLGSGLGFAAVSVARSARVGDHIPDLNSGVVESGRAHVERSLQAACRVGGPPGGSRQPVAVRSDATVVDAIADAHAALA